jgi:protein-S-isoprenylcysteine O-methyltransferase Ste14
MEYCILVAAWIAFSLLHSVLASEKCKAFFMSKMGANFKYYRLIYSMVAMLTLGGVLAWQFTISDLYFTVSPCLKYFVALPCTLFAAILMVICIRKYFYKLSGVEVLYHQAGRPVLETHGVHKFVRHPLYIGTLLLIWSLLLLFPSLTNLLACVMITGYVVVGTYSEERRLIRVFGREYEDYKKNTPMLIPSIGGKILASLGRNMPFYFSLLLYMLE